jgi:Spy/CpxP family protein refolding chaperone
VLQQHVKYAKEYKKILTPEQQKKLNDHIDQMENERLTRRAGAGLLGGYNGPQRR